jgi:hypothetical protein
MAMPSAASEVVWFSAAPLSIIGLGYIPATPDCRRDSAFSSSAGEAVAHVPTVSVAAIAFQEILPVLGVIQ